MEEARWKATAITDATWGFRTGFSIEELPKRGSEISPIPEVSGPIGEPKPQPKTPLKTIGHILRGEIQSSFTVDVLLIDNLDSFTENIANSLVKLGKSVRIVEGRPKEFVNPQKMVNHWLEDFKPKYVIIGPGPSRPEKSEITMEIARLAVNGKLIVENYQIPVLGLCLGHQALGLAVGWELIESPLDAVHGIPSLITQDNSG